MLCSIIQRQELQERLCQLPLYLPDQQDSVYEFARALADKLPQTEVTPSEFLIASELLLYDLQMGKDGHTDEKIRSSLVGNNPRVYENLSRAIPAIASAVAPPEFAEQVLRQYIKE